LPSRYELPRRNSGQLIKVANAPKAAGGKLPALYTKEQATAGLQSYALNCSFCHGGAMEGRNGPALKGEKFANVKTNFAIGDIFFVLSMQMPAANPGTLPKEEYAALMAYILQQNGYPAGTKKLDYDQALKSTVPLIYSGP
jgi:mono/diheme cytochrome c family protein